MKAMTIKEGAIVTLVLIAFLFILCINPADDSQTWFHDLLITKFIGVSAVLLAVCLHKYWKIENPS